MKVAERLGHCTEDVAMGQESVEFDEVGIAAPI
jgi:hypothetical protein